MKRLMGSRMTSLLKNAAKTFEEGSDPFSIWWLRENEVTADECMSMSDIIGTVIGWFIDQTINTQAQVLLHGCYLKLKTAEEVEERKGES